MNNNLPPEERLKEQNIALLGMWIHENLPPPQQLLEVFISKSQKNFKEGNSLYNDIVQ